MMLFSDVLKAAGWDAAKHPRWDDGPGGEHDGRFKPKGATSSAGSDDALLAGGEVAAREAALWRNGDMVTISTLIGGYFPNPNDQILAVQAEPKGALHHKAFSRGYYRGARDAYFGADDINVELVSVEPKAGAGTTVTLRDRTTKAEKSVTLLAPPAYADSMLSHMLYETAGHLAGRRALYAALNTKKLAAFRESKEGSLLEVLEDAGHLQGVLVPVKPAGDGPFPTTVNVKTGKIGNVTPKAGNSKQKPAKAGGSKSLSPEEQQALKRADEAFEAYLRQIAADPEASPPRAGDIARLARMTGRRRERVAEAANAAFLSAMHDRYELQQSERASLSRWIGSSTDLTKYWLHGNQADDDTVRHHAEQMARVAARATAKAEFFVYRSVSSRRGVMHIGPREIKMGGRSLRRGMSIVWNGVSATSLSRETAANWSGQVLTRIRVPAGQRFGPTYNTGEAEVLLPRFAQLKVRSVRKVRPGGPLGTHRLLLDLDYVGLAGDPLDPSPARPKRARAVRKMLELPSRFVGDIEDYVILDEDPMPDEKPVIKARTFREVVKASAWEQVPPLIREALQVTKGRLDVPARFDAAGDQRKVVGWASVVALGDGSPVLDVQDNLLSLATLQKAVRKFATRPRQPTGVRHGKYGEPTDAGPIAEMFLVTPEVKKDLGLDPSCPYGLLVASHVENDAIWQRVKKGEFRGWSIGGRAIEIEQGAAPFDALIGFAKELVKELSSDTNQEVAVSQTFKEVLKGGARTFGQVEKARGRRWDPADHPRHDDGPGGAPDGRFKSKGGGAAGKSSDMEPPHGITRVSLHGVDKVDIGRMRRNAAEVGRQLGHDLA